MLRDIEDFIHSARKIIDLMADAERDHEPWGDYVYEDQLIATLEHGLRLARAYDKLLAEADRQTKAPLVWPEPMPMWPEPLPSRWPQPGPGVYVGDQPPSPAQIWNDYVTDVTKGNVTAHPAIALLDALQPEDPEC